MWKVPLSDTVFDEREGEAVQKVLHSGWLTMGETTRQFEERFSELLSVKHAIAVSSCTAALHLANRALGIAREDGVICPALSFVAAANSIRCLGAVPVFADIQSLDDLCLSPSDIESRINPSTKAIQVVHFAGYPCDMDAVMSISKRHGLPVIEDCAHAPGAEYKGRKCGTIGDLGCFSFYSTKNMTTAEGGMVTTNDDALADKVRLLRSHGMTSVTIDRHEGRAYSYDVVDLGYNYRIDEIRSAIGLVQLEKLEDNNARRQLRQKWYLERLGSVPRIRIPFRSFRGSPAHHIFPILLDPDVSREGFMSRMKERGLQTSIHYPPIHLFGFYRQELGCKEGSLPTSEEVGRRETTLPLYPSMHESDVEYVCRAVAEVLGEEQPA